MFTGIVDHCGTIVNCQFAPHSRQAIIASEFKDLQLGESIAINGACLTVVHIEGQNFTVDISPDTLRVTNLDNLNIGDKVNLEKPMRLTDYVNGHLVAGHVEQVFQVLYKEMLGEFLHLRLGHFSEEQRPFLLHKGSITLNGVSLTINKIDTNTIEVLLIPETLRRTNLLHLAVGDRVNVEYDMVIKTIAQQTALLFSRYNHVE